MTQVLLLVSTLDGSGPGRVMAALALELKNRGVSCLVVATHGPTQSALVQELETGGVATANLGMVALWDARGLARLASLVRRQRPSVLHTRTTRADLLGRAMAPFGVPVVNNVVNLYPDDPVALHGRAMGATLVRLSRITASAASLVVANAVALATNAHAVLGVATERLRVVHDGLHPLRLAASRAPNSSIPSTTGRRICLTVARLHSQKGLADLIDAAALVDAQLPVAFLVAGAGPERAALEARVERLGLREVVHFLGQREDIGELLAAADLFVLPSRFEGLPSAIIEALLAGVPVVATDVGGVADLVGPATGTGWLVPPSAPTALADAVVAAFAADLAAVGEAGRQRALKCFSVNAMTDGFLRVYGEVADVA